MKNFSLHTLGPWVAINSDLGGLSMWEIRSLNDEKSPDDPKLISYIVLDQFSPWQRRNRAEDFYNAYLIAAAPELLEVCEEIAAEHMAYSENPIAQRLRDVIAKTKGITSEENK